MNKITIILLIAFLCLTVWIVYECLEHFFGARIRANFKTWREDTAALKLYEANELARKKKKGKESEFEDVEVEEVLPTNLSSEVFYTENEGVITFELITISE